MVKTRSQTGNETIKKEEQEDHKPSLRLNGVSNTKNNNQMTKRKPPKNNNRLLPVPQVKVEEDTDIKSLLKSTPNSLKVPKRLIVSQEQINQLIDYVVNHGMSVNKASLKVNMRRTTGFNYYKIYKNDPDKKIPSPRNQLLHPRRCYTQEQVENLIRYINGDKMTIKAASEKANMSYDSGHKYYSRYLNDPDHNIPIPRVFQNHTQDQKNEFIGYIVNDKMNIKEASKKAKMSPTAGRTCYHKYFDNQNPNIVTPSHVATCTHYTKEQKKQFISYVIDDKMTTVAASRKVNINQKAGRRHYRKYLKDNNMELLVPKRYTQDEINEFIGYVVDDKMDVIVASKKANINSASGKVYYSKYRKAHNLDLPALKYKQDKIKELAGYIIDDKMTIKAASKKANMSESTGYKYYRQYRRNQKRHVPT